MFVSPNRPPPPHPSVGDTPEARPHHVPLSRGVASCPEAERGKYREPKKPRTSKKNSAQAAVQQDGGCQQRSSSLPDIARGSPSWSSQGSWGAQRPSSMPYPGYHNASAQAYQRYPYPGAPSATGYPYPHPGYHYPYGGTNGSAHGHVGYPGMSHHHHHHYGDSSSTAAAAMMSYNAHSHGYPHHPYASGSTAPHPPYHPNAFYPRMPAPSPQDPCSGASSARSLHSRRSAGAGVTAAAAYQAGYMPHHLPPSEESHSPYPGMMAMGMYPNRTSTPASVTEKRLGAASGSSNLHRPSCPTPPQPPSSSSMSFNPSHVLPPTSSSSSSTASSSFPPHPLPLPQPATKRKQPSTVAGVTPTVKKKRKKLKYSGLLANVNGTLHPLNPSIPVIPPSPAVPQPTVSSSVNVNPKKSQVVSEPSPTSSTTSTTTATSSKPSTTTSTTHPATSNPSLPSNGPSFMDDPSGYLQHQTALLNKTLSQQPSMAEEASGGPTEESKKINAVQRPRRPPSPEDKASKEVAQQCSPSGSDDDCRSASPCSKSMEDLTAVSTSQTTTTTMTASSSSPSATFSAADSSSATVGAPQSSPSTPLPPLSIPPSPAEPTPSPEMEDDLGTTTVIPEVSEEQMETRSEEDKTIDEEPEQTNVQMAPSPRPLLAEDVTVSSPTSSCPTSSEESTTTTTAIASSSAHQKLRSVRRRTSSGIGQTQEPTVHSTQSDSPPQSLRIDEEEGSGGGGLGKMTSDLASSGTPLFEMSTGDDDECDGVPVLSIPSPPAAMADSTSTLEDPGELLLRCMTTTSSESTTSSNEITTTSQLSRPTTPEKEVMEKEIEDEEEELRKQTIIEEEEVYGKDEEQKGSRTKVGFEETSQEQMQMEVQIEEEQSQENPVIQTPRPEVPVKKQRTKAVDGGTSQETGHSGINTPVKKHSSTAVTTSTTSSSSTSKRSKSSTTRTSSSVNFSPCRPTVPIAPAGLPYNPAPMPQFIMTSTGQLLPLASTFGPFPSAPSNCHPSPQLVYLQHPAAPQPAPQLTSPTLNAEADDVFKRKKKRKQQPPQGTNQLQPQQATSIAISQAQPQHSFVQLGSATGQTHPQAGGFMSFPGTPFVLMSSSAPHNKLVISPAGNLVATPTSQPQTTMTQCQSQGPFIQNFIGSHFPAATVQNGTILLGPPNFPFFNPVPNGTFITTSSTAAPQQQTSGCMDSPHGISQSNASVSSQAEQHQSQSGVLLSPKTSTTNMSSSPTGPNLLPLIRPAAPPGPVFLQAAPPRFFTPGTPCPPQFVITTPSPNGTPTLISPIPSSSKSPSVKDPSTPLLVATSPVPISTGNAMLLSPTHRTSVSPSCARKRKHSNVQGGGQAGEPSAKCAKALIPSSDKELLVTNEGTTVIPEHPVSLTQTNPAVA
ncbi:unnamed protein product [Cyprideis torosa]|uniref:Uncharacterized protein n=1 Tax=Cyprideis torosa TaxID=163714 RepID=A0A7R8W9H6_9CRUS|nr:unnamed protein product [Cyprideis torosa]CAG0888533.1 unnamed protein product [Cyprideis torosa]